MTAAGQPSTPSSENAEYAAKHLALVGIVPTPPTRTEIDRLRIEGPDGPDGPLTTYYASDNEVGMQMRKGGVDGAEHAEHGSVAVLLGIDGHTMARVGVQVPCYWAAGLSDVDVFSLAIAHLATVRDELARMRGAR